MNKGVVALIVAVVVVVVLAFVFLRGGGQQPNPEMDRDLPREVRIIDPEVWEQMPEEQRQKIIDAAREAEQGAE